MAELLDIYDEAGNHIGVEDRKIVHAKGLWHKTIHCWIVKDGTDLVFQRRASTRLENPCKFYTTASGHLAAGESVEDAFRREMKEELGIQSAVPEKLFEDTFRADFMQTDGAEYRDRVFCSVFFIRDDRPLSEYRPQVEELEGVAAFPMRGALDLFGGGIDSLPGTGWLLSDGGFAIQDIMASRGDFVCNPGETLAGKYGGVIEEILKRLA